MDAFLATVTKVYLKSDKPLKKDTDFVKKYNGNESFDTNDIRFLGAIEFARESAIVNEGYAFPYDKNNMTYPILGETILVITDGEPDDRKAVFEIIIRATQQMEKDEELGISMIQVGSDPQATKFLKALDDQLQSVGAKFDICDTVTLDDLEDMSLADVLMNAITD